MALSSVGFLGWRITQNFSCGVLAPIVSNVNLQQFRFRKTKHWNPKFRKLRGQKFIKVDLPDTDEVDNQVKEERVRSRMKQMGVFPPRPWMERPFFLSATGGIFEPYVPPEGDGKISPITTQGAKQKLQFLEKKTKTMLAIRKIRSYEEDFDAPEFCKYTESIYKEIHQCMADKDKEKLENLVTERAYPEVVHNIDNKTIHWKYLDTVELPRIVHARCTDLITKDNIFAQITVRFHTKQLLAIYDRFGRLMHGSEILAKDVLEYIVFEKHLSNEYGMWRLHDKIIPDWLPPRENAKLTYRKPPKEEPVPDKAIIEKDEQDSRVANTEETQTSSSKPQPAIA